MRSTSASVIAVAVATTLACAHAHAQTKRTPTDQLRRGQYLVEYGGCHDCHTPKIMTPNGPAPDKARLLAGHPASSPVPAIPPGVLGPDKWVAMTNNDLTAWAGPWGVSFAANLTPDKETGLGAWTRDQFVKSMRTGKHLGVGRPILPPMPWWSLAALTDQDINAVFAYLQSVQPIRNKVPEPVPPK